MPRFLLITIIILVLAGHLFAVKEYTPEVPVEKVISLEDLYFNDDYKDSGSVQIIESPTEVGSVESMYINEGESCIFFENEGIPRVDVCPGQAVNENSATTEPLSGQSQPNNVKELSF